MLSLRSVLTAALALTAGPLLAQTITYQEITPAGQFNQATNISSNGTYVCGAGGTNGFIWSKAGGLVTGFGLPVDAWGVSNDGQTMVGMYLNASSVTEAGVWTAGGGTQLLGNLFGAAGCNNDLSQLNDISDDGTTAVGMSWQGCRTTPMRWTEGVGLTVMAKQNIDSSARTSRVSDNGLVAVGWDQGTPSAPGFTRRGCVWLDDDTQWFPCTTGANPNGYGEVVSVNSDGSVFGGTTQGNPFRWTPGAGLQILPKVPGLTGTHYVNGISEDGSVAVGVALPGGTAFLWTPSTGTVRLSTFLSSHGVTANGANLINATGVSADGSTICGWGGFSSWVVTIDNTWSDLGQGLAGTHGLPVLVGSGDLSAGSTVTITLSNALENATAGFVLGLSALNAPFKGGTMVPNPDFIIPGLTTTGTGSLTLSSTWPAGVPPGFLTYFQEWIVDPAAPKGFSASNGLSGAAP